MRGTAAHDGGAGSPSRPEFQAEPRPAPANQAATQARSEKARSESGPHPVVRSSRLWLWVFAAFALQALAWTAWFVVASHHPVQEIPLVRVR